MYGGVTSRMERSQMSAGIPTGSRRTARGRERPTQGSLSSQARVQQELLSGHYSRVVGLLRRVASVLDQDVEKRLPQVSVNSLERHLKEFVEDARLGLRDGDSFSNRGSSRREGYGRKLAVELVDPELAARVRANRRQVAKDIETKFMERNRGR